MSHGSSLRYVVVWAVLLALTATTYFAAKADLGGWHLTVAMLIAVTSGALVALFFMRLSSSRVTIRATFVVSLTFVALLIAGVLADAATRSSYALPPEAWPKPIRPIK